MKNIPKVRFPEFRDDVEWEEKPLQNIADFVNKKIALSVLNPKKYISTENILQDFAGLKETNTLPPSGSATEFLVGDILVSNIRPYLKKICVAEFDGGASNDVIVIRSSDGIYRHFLSYILKNDAFIDFVMAGAKGVKMPRGDTVLIRQYPVFIPQKPEEQQKIAECLSSLDALILAQSSKIEALKAHKKALMQQLFSVEDETTPRLRFLEFQNAPEWEEKPLGDIFDFLRGSLFSKADIVQNGANKCIHYGELFTIYKEKISEIKSFTNLGNGQFSQNGDILMPSSDVTPEGLATASAIFETGVIIGGDVNLLRPKNQISSLYISYLLNFSKKEIMKLVTGTTVKHIYNKDIAKLKIRIPQQIEEQQKIAECLSSLDELILAQSNKIETLKQHKKALMQQLFPNNSLKDN